jgi:hypothetical protein
VRILSVRRLQGVRGIRRAAHAILFLAGLFLGGQSMTIHTTRGDETPAGPRAAAWKAVDKALEEGKPKTAAETLQGVEQAAVADRAWAEVARAIATRILAETGDRPGDDPERLVLLAGAIDKAPPETRGVLEAIQANWTWGFFLQNRWRFQQRTAGGTEADDLSRIAEWDLPSIVAEIRKRFAVAVGEPGSPERKALQSLPVAEWSAILQPGKLSDAYRPTVWDVIAHDAIAFASSGERGLVAPEDAFELDADSPALGTPDQFLTWQPEANKTVTDLGSPLLETARLYRGLLEFHRADADRTAFLAADLDRILWASAAAVSQGDAADLADRKGDALERFIERAGDHETASLARFHLASLLQQGDGRGEPGDLVEARAIALKGAETHPKSPGGVMCKNLIAQIESKELSLQTERSWAEPWPAVRVSYRNLAKVHLRIAKADWMGRLKAGKPHAGWMDDADRQAILALPSVREKAFDLPATADYQQRHEDLPVGTALDAKSLEPGPYWVIASHKADFGAADNVVQVTLVWVTRLAIVAEQQRQVFGNAAAMGQQSGPVGGHVVDIASGEPVAGATVKLLVREQQGNHPQRFVERGAATTDQEGRYELSLEQGREYVVLASAARDGKQHEVATDATSFWRNIQPDSQSSIVLVTDRGIHRPGQIVFYKGIACASNVASGEYRAVDKRAIDVVFRDANGREVTKARHTTTANGSFHGNFPIPTGALPGQWSILAQAPGPDGFSGAVGVRVEEYKRPKFLVTLAAPEKSTPLGGEVTLSGTATTYTGVAVSGAKVRWHVERTVRFPIWCRWFFPWLSFDGGGQRIARGTAVTDADGKFSVAFTAKADKSVPKESLPVFTYRVVADVTDPSGETRSDERTVNAGYTDVEAALSADAWQATGADGTPAAVAITLATTTLDGQPRGAAGTLTVSKLVQPAEVNRGGFFGAGPGPGPRPMRSRRGPGRAAGRPAPLPLPPNPADAETWAVGEAVYQQQHATDRVTGKLVATATLPAGIYKAVFEIPAAGDVPAVKAERLIEVINPGADRYGVKRAFVLKSQKQSVEVGSEFSALVGTGYDTGRALVEISQSGKTLKRFWTEAGRTQWPVTMKVGDEHRGGFTVRAWLVRDGRLHMETQTVDVPWTNKKLSIVWERFTRRLEPGAKEVWRAKIASVADPVAGPAAPALAEMVATLYDQSLDALAQHQWPGDGLMGLFRRESSWLNLAFTNSGEGFNQILGNFATSYAEVPEISYRVLRDPFGSPMRGGWLGAGFGGGRRMLRGMRFEEREMAAAPMAMAAAPADLAMDAVAENGVNKRKAAGQDRGEGQQDKQSGGPAEPAGAPATAAAPPPRKNLVETAFFLPSLTSDKDGTLTIEFTLPDTLTTWQFKGLAHDASLRSGTIVDRCVSAKDLMVEPVMPRFLREGDLVRIPVKVSNTSTGRLAGTVTFALFDARTNDSRDSLVDGPRQVPFDLAAGESQPVTFTVKVADGTDTLRYLATGSAGKAADGEEAFVLALPRRVVVSESVPVTLRGPGERKVSLDRLVKSAGTDIQSQSLVVQAASNPAWYAVLALPAIMEQTDESTETLFTRLYANSLARHLATSDPRIGRVFEQWKGTDALESPLQKNTDLVKTLLAETPWVRDAVDEKEARARIALLFDATRTDNEMQAALNRLQSLRNGDGGWPWFPGGQTCDSVTLGILAGFGRLRVAGVKAAVPGGNDLVQPALQTIPWLDGRLIEEKRRAEKLWAGKLDDIVLTPIGVYALYARSFFTADAPPEGEAAAAIQWALDIGRKCWMKLDARLTQGQLAIALARSGDKPTALSIIDSLRQRAVDADVKPGMEKDSWQGMWWRDPHPGWWSWTYAPIATQTIMIEAFDEVAGDRDAVEALKVWLLSQKRTSQWRGSRATADAVSALVGRGEDLLGSQELVAVTVGGERVQPAAVEAGTGFFEERFTRREILPTMGEIVVTKQDKGLAFGGVHWQYLDDIANVPAAGREELSIEKQLFIKRMTKAGPELVPAAKDGAATQVEVGDELVVRLVVKSDRDYEFLELKDHRPSLTEPVDVLSGWRWGDGVGWYVAVRDASTQLFFERLPRGTHVFEYALRAAHRGTASSGFATIQSRYAPEFSAHSASIPVEVK